MKASQNARRMSWQRRMCLLMRHRDQAVHDHEDLYIVFRRKPFAIMESTAESADRLLSVSQMGLADLCRLGQAGGLASAGVRVATRSERWS